MDFARNPSDLMIYKSTNLIGRRIYRARDRLKSELFSSGNQFRNSGEFHYRVNPQHENAEHLHVQPFFFASFLINTAIKCLFKILTDRHFNKRIICNLRHPTARRPTARHPTALHSADYHSTLSVVTLSSGSSSNSIRIEGVCMSSYCPL